MNTNFWMMVAVVMTSALSQACSVETAPVEEIDEASSELRVMNGSKLSGVSLSGVDLGGATLDGVSFANVSIGGVAVSNVHLVGTVLHGVLPGGHAISGDEFIGAELTGVASNGASIQLRIDNIEVSAQADVLHYTVSARKSASESYASLCGVDAYGATIKALPLAGRWDSSAGTATGGSFIGDTSNFTMACRGAALAKCVEIGGYKPWETKQQCTSWGECSTISLAPAHQACVRMVRADYCGDGQSLTINGTEIDMYDGLGLKDADPTAEWDLEAEWTPKGAQCVSHVRWSMIGDLDVAQYMTEMCPEKIATPETGLSCGDSESTFFVDNGFMTPDQDRVFLRNKSFIHQ